MIIYRKLAYLAFLVLLSVLAGSASATNYFWDDEGTGHLWSTSNNWNPNGTPGSSDFAFINLASSTCEITSAVSAVCDKCIVGYTNGSCYLEMTGGTLNVNAGMHIGYQSAGHVDLHGGTISATSLTMGNDGGCGTMDIEAGTLILKWFQLQIDQYIKNGWITSYGNSDPRGISVVYEDSNAIITSTSYDPGKAWNPNLADDTKGVPVALTLTWTPGDWVASHNVYFGTDFNDVNDANDAAAGQLAGNINDDCRVDFNDVAILCEQWLTDPNNLPSADLNDDNNVNLIDFAILANNWGRYETFRGNQDSNSFNPGPLDWSQTYYWRIDEVNDSNDDSPWKGNVWKFKTTGFQKCSVIVLPDTQFYSQSYPATFTAQTQWIVNNKDTWNIAYAAHEGDVVDVSGNTYQWDNANAAMSLLEDPCETGLADGIPYGISPGNHDEPTTNFNSYFGISRFSGRSYYGGHYGSNNDNSYMLFSSEGLDFIVVNLEYEPASAVIDWADDIIAVHSDRRAMVVSHYILNTNGNFGTSGQQIYDTLKDNPNLFLMLCGHMHGEARRTDTYNSNTVYTLLADYQDEANGGNGWLRIMEFSPENNEIYIRTYSPTLNQWQTDVQSQFTLTYDMTVHSQQE